MLREIYLFSAVVGGTVFIVQFLMSMLALGGHRIGHRTSSRSAVRTAGSAGTSRFPGSHATTAHRLGSPTNVGTPVANSTVPHIRPGQFRPGHMGTGKADIHAARHTRPPIAMGHQQGTHPFAANAIHLLLAMLDIQALVAGATVFGLSGLACVAFQFSMGASLAIAGISDISAMALVITLLQYMENMDEEGTVRLVQAIGQTGTVYLSIPAQRAGMGKILVPIQGRSMELPAITYQELPITTGSKVVVVGVEDPNVAQVIPADRIPWMENQP